jgi:hypothetical protein
MGSWFAGHGPVTPVGKAPQSKNISLQQSNTNPREG